MTKKNCHLGIVLFLIAGQHLFAQAPPIGKVVDSYLEGTTTQMLIEAKKMLNTSQTVYLHGGIPLTIREVMSLRETEGVYYYRTYTPEKVRVLPGENVFLEITTKEQKLKRFEKEAIFMKKKYATVTFAEEEKALINRGSLHNVDKRDVYRVYNSSGRTLGEIELYGIGDFLSAGRIQYPMEQGGKSVDVREGDQVVFVGNRKVIGTGFSYSIYSGKGDRTADSGATRYTGGGILWSMILRKGRIIELMTGSQIKEQYPVGLFVLSSAYAFPLWFRKAFFYPGPISPSIAVGASYFKTSLDPQHVNFEKINRGFSPALGLGVEFFSGNTLHLRLDFQYYYSPPKKYLETKYHTDSLFLLGGLSFNW